MISTPRGIGGAERVTSSLVRVGAERGHDQVVLNPFGLDNRLSELFPGARFVRFPCSNARALPALRRWLERALRGFRAEIVHAHLFHATVAVASLPHRVPRLLTHHHGDWIHFERPRHEALIDRWAGMRYDRVVAVSEAVGRFLVEDYRFPRERVVVIPNGWHGTPRPRNDAARPPTVIAIGNLRPEKGHWVLLDAMAEVRRTIPDARLVLVGDGPLRADLEARARQLGLGVEFAGEREDIWPFLAAADVLALPSFVEQRGIAAIEAMAAGVPVVASHVGGIPEVVEHGVNGMLVPPRDATALAAGLVSILRDPDEAARMGEAGRRTAEPLGADRMADRYMDLYQQLAWER